MIKIVEVGAGDSKGAFLDLPRELYRRDSVWVSPLDMEIEGIFNPSKNLAFRNGEATRWVARDKDNKVVGRIGAFVNRTKAFGFEQPTGGVGFFECIDSQEVANALFDTSRAWLLARGMEAMDGPINFGENEHFWGLLVEGFTHPSFGMNYNPVYYKKLFEGYGFEEYYSQTATHLDITKSVPERWVKIIDWVKNKQGVRFEHCKRGNLMKYGMDFLTIYNDAWQFHPNFTAMTEEQIQLQINKLKDILIEEMTLFAYVDNEPAGFMLCLPDINQIFKQLRGKFGLWDIVLFLWRKRNQFAWYRKRGILTRGRAMIVGVRPKFQGYGLDAGLIFLTKEPVRNLGFSEIELSWVGEFNSKMMSVMEASGASFGKKYITYRYLFDRNKKVERLNKLAE